MQKKNYMLGLGHFCRPDSETLTSNTHKPVGLSPENGGYRGEEPL